MILQVVIIRRSTKEVLFNYCFESEKHIDEVYLSQFAVTIAEVIPALFSDSTERIQFMKTSLHKVVFEVFDDYIFVIISTADTDDLELNYLLTTIVNRAVPLLRSQNLSALHLDDLIFKGKIRRSGKQTLPKLILLRFGEIYKAIQKLKMEVEQISSMHSYDTQSIIMLSSTLNVVEKSLKEAQELLKKLPYIPPANRHDVLGFGEEEEEKREN